MGAGSADARLLTKNELLEHELEELTTRLDTLQTSVEDLSRKDEYYRLLAGLEPLDADVLRRGSVGRTATASRPALCSGWTGGRVGGRSRRRRS
jgi:hypothetical protein